MRNPSLQGHIQEMNTHTRESEKQIFYRKMVVFCLLALLLSFASLVPGGPVENRDFSHLGRATFNGFNLFLIALWLAGCASLYRIWKGRKAGYRAAIIIGWLYIIVVASDLGHVFPVSPDPTGFVLGMIMILDGILAFNAVLFSHKALGEL
jgi:tryptophan-rich sensory protein